MVALSKIANKELTDKKPTPSLAPARPALYTVWRLLNGDTRTESGRKKQIVRGDVLELFDWDNCDFTGEDPKIRKARARLHLALQERSR